MKRVVTWLMTLAAGAWAQQSPPDQPILRIETGMHTAIVKQIGVDAAERYLVSSSYDKTVRVWELPTGKLLRILRPPIADSNEGKLYAVAISPDGRTVACGGWSGYDWEHSHSIYIFDRETGRLVRRLPGLPNAILGLAFSRDGRFLVATLARQNGIRLFRTSDYALAAEDRDYGDDTYSADFFSLQASGNTIELVTTSYDGFVRLYDVIQTGGPTLRLMAKVKPPGGSQPRCARFSPDGSCVVIGFDDSTRLDVLSARNLSPLYSPDTGDANTDLSSVEWSKDGKFLYAAGRNARKGDHPILRWVEGGRGRPVELPGTNDTIVDMVALRNGDLVYGSADPELGVLDHRGKRTFFNPPPVADFRGSQLRISADASVFAFTYGQFGKASSSFSLSARTLTTGEGPGGLRAPLTVGLDIKDWHNALTPKLDETPIKLEPHETSRRLAVSGDRQQFLLGADWSLRLFDRSGKPRWKVPAPGVTWAVNLSADGKLAVAAFGDGTIRWYRITDGKELLAFFPHADRKRWVLWTPSGYYDASPGGEDLIGWHVNNGWQAADFFPASRFRNAYYRPDVVARVLAAGDESEALRLADADAGHRRDADISRTRPPVVTLLSPAADATFSAGEITVRYSVRSPSGEPVTALRALVDGRPLPNTRRIVPVPDSSAGEQEIHIPVPQRDCEISLVAENRFASSEPARVRVHWAGAEEAFVIRPKLYVLAIGISRYPAPNELHWSAKDAADFVAALRPQKGRLYRDMEVKLLTDDQATRDDIVDGLDWIEKSVTQHDVAMVFLSGHGYNDTNGTYYFLPANFQADRLKRTAVAMSDIKSTVQNVAGKVVLFLDTCYSGNVLGGRAKGFGLDINAVINELSSAENGAVVFAASSGRQMAIEEESWRNGAFTRAVIEGLNGKADYAGTGKITINMLDLYISERVKELTGGKQTPTTTKPQTISDFPIALRQ